MFRSISHSPMEWGGRNESEKKEAMCVTSHTCEHITTETGTSRERERKKQISHDKIYSHRYCVQYIKCGGFK